jgi:hypothetical protein
VNAGVVPANHGASGTATGAGQTSDADRHDRSAERTQNRAAATVRNDDNNAGSRSRQRTDRHDRTQHRAEAVRGRWQQTACGRRA